MLYVVMKELAEELECKRFGIRVGVSVAKTYHALSNVTSQLRKLPQEVVVMWNEIWKARSSE